MRRVTQQKHSIDPPFGRNECMEAIDRATGDAIADITQPWRKQIFHAFLIEELLWRLARKKHELPATVRSRATWNNGCRTIWIADQEYQSL